MIDELLFKTNHLGKDGFIWWIGQVAPAEYWKSGTAHTNYKDPDKERKNWPERCKVRIIGYHTFNKKELEDKDLPLAHIMMDPVFGSGQGGEGITSNLQGGEVCFGFFLDGEDAQQPVIMGLMSRPRQVLNEPENQDFAFRPFTGYKGTPSITRRKANDTSQPKEAPKPAPFTYSGETYKWEPNIGWASTDINFNPKAFDPTLTLAGIDTTTRLNYCVNFSDNILTNTETAAYSAFKKLSTFSYTPPSECRNNLIGQITQILQDFIGFTNGIQKFADTYIDPVLNEVVDIGYEIKSVASSIGGIIRLIINSIRSSLTKCITSLFKTFFNLQCEPFKTILSQSFKNILNIVYCLFEKIIPDLLGFLEDLLSDLVDNVFSAPICAINHWVAGILTKVMDNIDKALEPVLSGIDWLTGGPSNVFDTLNNVSSLANQIYNFIGCDDLKCTTPSKWVSTIGPSKQSADDWISMVGNINVFKGLSDELGSIESAVAGLPIYSQNMSSFTGTTIIKSRTILEDKTNLIIANPGTGYTTGITTYKNVPLVSLTGDGKGAKALIGVGTGVVFSAVVTASGAGYKQGDILTIGKKSTNNLGSGVSFIVPSVKTIQTSYYDACANGVNNPTTQDDLPLNDGSTKFQKCIPPKIEIFGDGEGARLKPIISSGKLIGAEILSSGFSYSTPPILSVVDKSGYGSGAKITAEVDSKGSITGIVVLETGTGYCSPPVGIGTTSTNEGQEPTFVYLTSSKNRIYEGESVSFTITASGPNSPAEVNYEITGIAPEKIKQKLKDKITITNKVGRITIDTIEDKDFTSETLTFILPDYNSVAYVLVEDVTRNPEVFVQDYYLSSDLYTINEGSQFKVTLKTINVPNGTIVPFNIQVVNTKLIQNFNSYTAFEVYNNKAELTFKTNKGVISNSTIISLELNNKLSNVRIIVNKIVSPSPESNPNPQVCLTGIKATRPGIGYSLTDKATDGINEFDLIISPDNGAIFGAKPLANSICGYTEPPTLIIITNTGAGGELKPIVGVQTDYTNSIFNYKIITITDDINQNANNLIGNSNTAINIGINTGSSLTSLNAGILTGNENTTAIITGISSDSINVVDCV